LQAPQWLTLVERSTQVPAQHAPDWHSFAPVQVCPSGFFCTQLGAEQ
jgi:hypothetical protein